MRRTRVILRSMSVRGRWPRRAWLIAALALVVAFPSVTSQQSSARAARSPTIAASRTEVASARVLTTTGTVRASRSSGRVALQRRSRGRWITIDVHDTRPARNAPYNLSWRVPDNITRATLRVLLTDRRRHRTLATSRTVYVSLPIGTAASSQATSGSPGVAGPNWTAITQALAGAVGAVGIIAALIFSALQTRALRVQVTSQRDEQVRSVTVAQAPLELRLLQVILDIDNVFVERPWLRPFFYSDVELPEAPDDAATVISWPK